MSLIELTPTLTGIEAELRGLRVELKRIADCLEAIAAPQLAEPARYTKPKKGAESVLTVTTETVWEHEQEKAWREGQGYSPDLQMTQDSPSSSHKS